MTLQTQLEKDKNKQDLTLRLAMVMQRTEQKLSDVNATVDDILSNFNYNDKTKRAILKGSLGGYGVTFKLTTQIVGSWIYKSQMKHKTDSI